MPSTSTSSGARSNTGVPRHRFVAAPQTGEERKKETGKRKKKEETKKQNAMDFFFILLFSFIRASFRVHLACMEVPLCRSCRLDLLL
jgi:hypothetical protein